LYRLVATVLQYWREGLMGRWEAAVFAYPASSFCDKKLEIKTAWERGYKKSEGVA